LDGVRPAMKHPQIERKGNDYRNAKDQPYVQRRSHHICLSESRRTSLTAVRPGEKLDIRGNEALGGVFGVKPFVSAAFSTLKPCHFGFY
jgi:hypothetical protein